MSKQKKESNINIITQYGAIYIICICGGGGAKKIMEKNAKIFYIVPYVLVNFHDERCSGENK